MKPGALAVAAIPLALVAAALSWGTFHALTSAIAEQAGGAGALLERLRASDDRTAELGELLAGVGAEDRLVEACVSLDLDRDGAIGNDDLNRFFGAD